MRANSSFHSLELQLDENNIFLENNSGFLSNEKAQQKTENLLCNSAHLSFNDSSGVDFSSEHDDSIDEKIMSISTGITFIADSCSNSFSENDYITINTHQYYIKEQIKYESEYHISLFNVVDELEREFLMKQILFSEEYPITDFLAVYNLLKENKYICLINNIDISYNRDLVTIIFEKSNFINTDLNSSKKNSKNDEKYLKKRKKSIKTILSAVYDFEMNSLRCHKLKLNDFVETSHGIKLMNFENLIIPQTQVFRIPNNLNFNKVEQETNLIDLVHELVNNDDPIYEKIEKSSVFDIPILLTHSFFVEDEKKVIISPKPTVIRGVSPKGMKSSPILHSEIEKPSIFSPSTPKRMKRNVFQRNAYDTKMNPIEFSFSVGILLMFTVSLVIKGIHEANFGFTQGPEIFFGLRLFWIMILAGLFYIVFKIRVRTHHKSDKLITKSLFQFIVLLGITLFFINLSLVFHLIISKSDPKLSIITLSIILLWLVRSLTLIDN